MLKPTDASARFSLTEARTLLRDHFRPDPRIYWADFLLSIGCGTLLFGVTWQLPAWLPAPLGVRWALQAVAFVGCCLLWYRAAMFIHELVHLRDESFRGFRVAWNLLCGIPFLMPSFVYYTHIDHHRRKHYGTQRDGEYLPLGTQPRRYVFFYVAQSFVIPLLAIARFLILSPLGWVSPRLRRWIHQRASSMVIDPSYIRPLPTAQTLRTIRLQEALCFCWCLGVALVPLLLFGRFPIALLLQVYLTSVVVLLLNSLRTLGAHRWTNRGGEMTFIEQMLDSVTVHRRPLISELWGPVGTRYHSLHHLFPSLPYHALPEAHRRLMARLPADSPYRATEERSLTSALVDLWRRAGEARRTEAVERAQAASNMG